MDLVTLAAFHLNLLHTYRRSWEFGSRFGVTTAWLAMRFIFLTGGWWRRAMTDTYLLGVNSKEIKPVSPKGNQPWIFIGRTDTKAETPKLWPTWFEELTHLKRPWCWERLKAGGEGDDRGWHGWMASMGHEFEQASGVGDGQGRLAFCRLGVRNSQAQLSDWTDW